MQLLRIFLMYRVVQNKRGHRRFNERTRFLDLDPTSGILLSKFVELIAN